MEEKTVYIKFMAPINSQTTNLLMNAIDNCILKQTSKIVLLLSTPGGIVSDGITLYNYLKGLSLTIETHNFGIVDSIGVVLYCAGQKRYSVKNARFLLHPIVFSVNGSILLNNQQLKEKISSLEGDDKNISSIIASEIGKTVKNVSKLISSSKSILSQEAKELGLVHEIKEELIPSGAELISINVPQ